MAAALPYIGAATGLLGVYQASKQADVAQQGINLAKKSEYYPNKARQDIYNIASKMDPVKDAQASIDASNENAAKVLQTALRGVNARSAAGGSPGGDTALSLRSLESIKNNIDPLRAWFANIVSNANQTKMNALSSVISGFSGSPASNAMIQYGSQADFGSPLQLFSASLSKIPGLSKKASS